MEELVGMFLMTKLYARFSAWWTKNKNVLDNFKLFKVFFNYLMSINSFGLLWQMKTEIELMGIWLDSRNFMFKIFVVKLIIAAILYFTLKNLSRKPVQMWK